MKLGAVPNLSSLTELPLLLERVWGQRPGREWAGPGVGKISAITCLGGVSAYLGLVLVLSPPKALAGEKQEGKG